jgi:hypothetical protein
MSRPRHPNKHIESAVRYAALQGWRVRMSRGHVWALLFCPHQARDGHKVAVYSTPRNPEDHARHIRREIDHCQHRQQDTAEAPPDEEGHEDEEDD